MSVIGTPARPHKDRLDPDKDAAAVRVPSHRLGPPETLTAVQYGNLIRAPDKRTLVGKRDHALLRQLGDCGLRNAEIRALTARAIRRPRANSTHHHLFVRGKGDVEREIPIPAATHAALEAWLRAPSLPIRAIEIIAVPAPPTGMTT